MNPISDAKFSDDFQKFVLQQQPNVDMVKYHVPEKKFSLEESAKKKKKDKNDKGDKEEKNQTEEEIEDSPWIPKPPKKK